MQFCVQPSLIFLAPECSHWPITNTVKVSDWHNYSSEKNQRDVIKLRQFNEPRNKVNKQNEYFIKETEKKKTQIEIL